MPDHIKQSRNYIQYVSDPSLAHTAVVKPPPPGGANEPRITMNNARK